jgi:hypothetical protein
MASEARRPGASSSTLQCARCGASFRCGIGDADGCWCARLPPLPRSAYAGGAGCVCEDCLREALAAATGAGSQAQR